MLRITAAVLFTCCIVGLVALFAARPEEEPVKITLRPLVIHEAEASTLVKHTVEWKNGIDAIRHETLLVGPRLYSTETELKSDATEAILFGWYELPKDAKDEAPRSVRVSTDKASDHEFRVGEAAYFLSMTQRLQEGTPAEPPKALSQFVAYRILEDSTASQTVERSIKNGSSDFILKRPAYVCLPTQEWHHDEYFGVSDASSCWIVYEIEPIANSDSVSTLDQFGFNKLSLGTAKWVCLPGQIKSID